MVRASQSLKGLAMPARQPKEAPLQPRESKPVTPLLPIKLINSIEAQNKSGCGHVARETGLSENLVRLSKE
jgi:hypothetical protein